MGRRGLAERGARSRELPTAVDRTKHRSCAGRRLNEYFVRGMTELWGRKYRRMTTKVAAVVGRG